MNICKYKRHLINQGIYWCEKQIIDFPKCCNEKCPYYEELKWECAVTSTSLIRKEYIKSNENRVNTKRKKTNKKRAQTK